MTTDEDIDRIVTSFSRQVFREVIGVADRVGVLAEAFIRFSPVATYCRLVREARGEDLKSAAKAVKVPQYVIRQLEAGEVLDLDLSVVTRYASHLDLEPWFATWARSNQRLVAILMQPPASRAAIRSMDIDHLVAALGTRVAMAAPRGRGVTPPGSPRLESTGGAFPASAEQALQLEIVLEGTAPPVWRRILVSSDATLHSLHRVVQSAVGWEDTHLYDFEIGGDTFSDPSGWDDRPAGLKDSRKVHLRDLELPTGGSFQYRYDFGDNWCHRISVERVGAASRRRRLPVCLAGERACPPEDAGGAPGYEEILAVLRDPGHPEHREIQEWLPGGFDPEAFDLVEANRRLQSSGAGRRRMSPSTV